MKALRYHEDKQRGSRDFPLDYHFVTKEHPRYVMPYHWHEETEIIHVVSGLFSLMIDDVTYAVKAGDIVYIASGCLHGGEPIDCIYECIVFDMRLLLKPNLPSNGFISDINSRKLFISPNVTLFNERLARYLLPMFDALGEWVAGNDLIAYGALNLFFGEVKRRGAYADQTGLPDRETRNVLRLKQVFEMIEARPNDPPAVRELARSIGMSTNHFSAFFKKATHQKPSQYISRYRIEQACYEMAATEKNLTEIAMDLGYCDLSNFSSCFKRCKGVTPRDYLNGIRSKDG